VRLLLDTHVFLWMQSDPDRMSQQALALVESTRHQLLFSAASSWEIAIKVALGKLHLPDEPETWVPLRMRSSGVSPLVIEHGHALAAGALPSHHRDPFDRLLIAQAQHERVPVVTADPAFAAYELEIIEA
jgi:PIN domain nuclease of toxin-antitoxin system